MSDTNYCGCCGRETQWGGSPYWCQECSRHVADNRQPPWDRTYEAIHGEPCPFQIPWMHEHYTSTYCIHERHEVCATRATELGLANRQMRCKTCHLPCLCACHKADAQKALAEAEKR